MCGSIYSLAKRGLPSKIRSLIQRHFQAEFAKLKITISGASDRVQSERPEDIPGSFKYHGFLEHAFRQKFSPVKRSNQCFGLRINSWTTYEATCTLTGLLNEILAKTDFLDWPSWPPHKENI